MTATWPLESFPQTDQRDPPDQNRALSLTEWRVLQIFKEGFKKKNTGSVETRDSRFPDRYRITPRVREECRLRNWFWEGNPDQDRPSLSRNWK